MADQDFGEVAFKAYAAAIKAKAGNVHHDPHMDKDYWYIAGDANRSIPASRYIPMATTNEFLFQEANILMKPTQPVYIPGAGTTGYVEALLQYLMSVEPAKGEESPEQKTKRKELEQELDEADENYQTRRRKARKDWAAEKEYDPDTTDFATWCRSHAKAFLAAESAYATANGKLAHFLLQLYKGDYADWDEERLKLTAAKLAKDYSAGVTMACKPAQVLDLAEAIQKAKEDGHGLPVPEPAVSENYYRAAYHIDPTYRDTMDRWALEFDNDGVSGSVKLDLESAKKKSWSEFGFETIDGGGGISFFGLFSIGARGGSHTSYKEIKVNESKSSVSIELSWKHLQFFNVTPGTWNIPNIHKKYRKTTERTPEMETLIRPVQFLCASKLTVTCKVTGEVKEQIDTAIKHQTSVGGGANVVFKMFGFYASGGYAREDNIETSTFTWDKSTGELKVLPAPTFGNSVLLGVRGQAVSI